MFFLFFHFLEKLTSLKIENFAFKKKKKKRCQKKKLPESVNPEENSRIEASVTDNLGLTHFHGLRHPIKESEVSFEVEVYEFSDQVSVGAAGTVSVSREIPFGEVDSVVDGLDS